MPFICWQTENIIISVTTQTNDLLHTSIKLFIFLPDYNPMGHKCHHVLHHLIISRLLVPTWRFLMSLQMLETQQILLEVRVRKMRSKGKGHMVYDAREQLCYKFFCSRNMVSFPLSVYPVLEALSHVQSVQDCFKIYACIKSLYQNCPLQKFKEMNAK